MGEQEAATDGAAAEVNETATGGRKATRRRERYELIPASWVRVLAGGDDPERLLERWWYGPARGWWLLELAAQGIASALRLAGRDVAADLAAVLGVGAVKYGDRNWERGLPWSWVYAAARRHLARGFALDPESRLPHLTHALWNVLALVEYAQHGLGTDDRPGSER